MKLFYNFEGATVTVVAEGGVPPEGSKEMGTFTYNGPPNKFGKAAEQRADELYWNHEFDDGRQYVLKITQAAYDEINGTLNEEYPVAGNQVTPSHPSDENPENSTQKDEVIEQINSGGDEPEDEEEETP